MMIEKLKVAAVVAAGMLAAGAGLVLARAMEAGAAEAEVGPPKQADTSGLATLRIESTPSGAKVFIRTGGHNGYAEVGRTPITLRDIEPGLLEYTLLRTDCQLYDGSLWIEPGREHVERVRMKPGRVFFVDQANPKASDDNPGTEAAPWKTLQHIARAPLRAGDTVLVRGGTYEEPLVWLRERPHGERDKPIVFRAHPGEDVLLRVPRLELVNWRDNLPVVVGGQDYVVIDGFRIFGRVCFWDEPHERPGHYIIRNCELWGGNPNVDAVGGSGYTTAALRVENTSHVVVSNCHIHDVVDRGNNMNYAAVMIFGSSYILTEHNLIEASGQPVGIDHKAGGTNRNIHRFNVVTGAGCAHYDRGATAGDRYSEHSSFYGNVCIRTVGLHLGWGPREPAFFNNTVWESVGVSGATAANPELSSWNNILASGAAECYRADGKQLNRFIVYSDHNLFFSRKAICQVWGRRLEWGRTAFDKHSIRSDPMFVDAAKYDFRLRPGSPCIDAGRPVTYAVGEGEDTDTITVEYAYSFTDGLGLIDGDVIQIGKGEEAQFARVLKVIDRTHLKLDKKVSWKDGDWVTFPFVGEAPDIGAYEYGDERRVIGPTWKHYPKRDFSRRGRTDS